MGRRAFDAVLLCLVLVSAISCQTTSTKSRQDIQYSKPTEAAWIINGEPIEFEGQKWYPQDGIEVLTDEEVYLLGTYRDVMFFAEKIDVRPYERLYTKFSTNKYRYFKL